MGSSMLIQEMGDNAILKEIGSRLKRERLNQNVSQENLAENAGISRRALQLLESGHISTTSTIIRMLRALGKLDAINSFLPEPGLSPLQLVKLGGHERQRSRRLSR
jgi:transcriptional regulator with XRE-family HTH domain